MPGTTFLLFEKKNITYCILEAMQKEMTFQQVLFDKVEITIDISKFMTSDNYNYVLKKLKNSEKTIWYDWKNDRGKIWYT